MSGRIFYKFREDSMYSEKIIVEKKIWLSTADKLNDPLECKTGRIPEKWKNDKILELEKGQIAGMLEVPLGGAPETLFSLDPARTKKWIKRLRKLPHDRQVKEMRSLYKDHGIEISDPKNIFIKLQKQLSEVGIFSMTVKIDNQPMWSHYANNHTGLAFGFRSSDGSKLSNETHNIPVVYSDEKPTFGDGFLQRINFYKGVGGRMYSEADFSFNDPVVRSAISTKPLAWKYEEEWRYVEERAGLFEYPGEMASVIFGLKMSKDRKNYYKRILKDNGIKVDMFEAAIGEEGNFYTRDC